MSLNVAFDCEDERLALSQRTVLASLPESFALGEGGSPDVVVVDGGTAPWAGRARRAVEAGARAVLVVPLAPEEPAALAALAADAAAAGSVVVPAPAFALDAAWTASLESLRADLSSIGLLDVLAVAAAAPGPEGAAAALDRSLLEQLALVGDLVELPERFELLDRRGGGYVAVASAGRLRLQLAGVVSAASGERLALDAVGGACRWSARFERDAPARPSEVRRIDAAGWRSAPAGYDSSYRRCWKALRAVLEEGAAPPYSLERLAGAVDLGGVSGDAGGRGATGGSPATAGRRESSDG